MKRLRKHRDDVVAVRKAYDIQGKNIYYSFLVLFKYYYL